MVVQYYIYLSARFRPTYRRSSSGNEKTLKNNHNYKMLCKNRLPFLTKNNLHIHTRKKNLSN